MEETAAAARTPGQKVLGGGHRPELSKAWPGWVSHLGPPQAKLVCTQLQSSAWNTLEIHLSPLLLPRQQQSMGPSLAGLLRPKPMVKDPHSAVGEEACQGRWGWAGPDDARGWC